VDEEELRYVELLDEVWWQLSRSDQELIEQELKQVAVQVREEQQLFDLAVLEGSSALPRRAA
jgi:hypothetical protein